MQVAKRNTHLARCVRVPSRAFAKAKLALPAPPKALDIAVLSHDQRVVFTRGGRDKNISIGLDTHLVHEVRKRYLSGT